jgi:hypothetical protein
MLTICKPKTAKTRKLQNHVTPEQLKTEKPPNHKTIKTTKNRFRSF